MSFLSILSSTATPVRRATFSRHVLAQSYMMKRERRPAPTGSSHQILALYPMNGKSRDAVLKMTSVLQSESRNVRHPNGAVWTVPYLAPKPGLAWSEFCNLSTTRLALRQGCVLPYLKTPIQMIPLTTMVLTIAQIAGAGSSTALRGAPGRHFSTDSFNICRKDTIII